MSSSVINRNRSHQNALQGHCSRCHRVWTLTEPQGVCQWCGKPATCQTAMKPSRKTSSRRGQRQAPAHSNDYDQLPEPYLTYYTVASRFAHKAMVDDQEDLLHDIIVALADVARHKTLTEPIIYRIASLTLADYWRAHYKLTNGVNCGNCSKAQRRECQKHWLYGKCPKAITIEHLSKPLTDSEGGITELGELIADDTAIDLDRWLDAKAYLLGFESRLISIAEKLRDGVTLGKTEARYLERHRKKEQKALF
ncbi:MAG TPA: hypothetical protein VMW64_08915 [Dehalococcoidia bacterium]|nr:hypothetical protein [Dehalococcoidia bacterium]